MQEGEKDQVETLNSLLGESQFKCIKKGFNHLMVHLPGIILHKTNRDGIVSLFHRIP